MKNGILNEMPYYISGAWTSDARALLYLPDDYDQNNETYPLIVFFRGGGEAGTDVNKLYGNGIPLMIKNGVIPHSSNNQKFIIACPQGDPVINVYNLNYLFDSIKALGVRVDYNKIYFTGLSRGAADALSQYLNAEKEGLAWKPAAAVIMSTGMAFYGTDIIYMKDSAFWFFIGDSDNEVGTEKGQLAYNQLKSAYPDGDFRLTVYKGGHGRWNDFYNPAYTENGINIYDWLLQYSIKKEEDKMNNGKFNVATVNGKANTLVYLPTNYDDKNSYPVIIFLHGSGESGTNLDKVKTQGLPKVVQAHIDKGDIAQTDLDKFIIAAQQYPGAPYYSPTPDWTFALLDYLKANFSVDEKRIYATGLSAGGNRCKDIVLKGKNLFAAFVPMSSAQWVGDYSLFAGKSFWFFCGVLDKDAFSRQVNDVNSINKVGGNAILTVYNAGHTGWPTYYEPSWKWTSNPTGKDIGAANGLSIYEWMLQHSLGEVEQPPTEQPSEPTKPEQPAQTLIQPVAIIKGGAKAGGSGTINLTLPDNSLTLDASTSTGTIDKWSWGIKGNSPMKSATLSRQGDKVVITNLKEGTYLFYVTVESSKVGWPSSDLMKVVVSAAKEQPEPELQFTLVSQQKTDNGYLVTMRDQNGKEYQTTLNI